MALSEYYVTVGFPDDIIPIADHVLIFVDPSINETATEQAKYLRKRTAEKVRGRVAKPSELFYEVYRFYSDTKPIAASANAPHQPKEKEKE
jgi:hypothetical protein